MSLKWSGIIRDAAQSLLEMFESGKMPEAVALTIIKRREGDDQPSFRWSMGNQILMFMQGTSDARGFRQWETVGRYVKKGAQAIYILAPIVTKYVEKDKDTGIEKERIFIASFKPTPVFRVEDTDGKPLIKPDYQPKALPPFWGVAEYMGIEVSFAPCGGDYYGTFSPSKQKITLCSQDSFVYFHELAHAVHYQVRDLKSGTDPEKEIVAETAAAVLCQLQGIQGYEDQSYKYIQDYARKIKEAEVMKAIMRVLGDVVAVVSRILETAEIIESPPVEQPAGGFLSLGGMSID